MQASDAETFKQATEMAQRGQKEAAHALLQVLNLRYPTDSSILLWMGFTAPNLTEARQYLNRVAEVDPAHPALAEAQKWLRAEEDRQLPATTTSVLPSSVSAGPTPVYSYKESPGSGTSAYTTLPGGKASLWTEEDKQVAKILEAKPKKRTGLFIIGSITGAGLVIGGIIYTLILFISFTSLPVFPHARRIDFSEADQKTLEIFRNQAAAQAGLKNLEVSIYAIGAAERDQAVTYYGIELEKQGWRFLANPAPNASATIFGYAKYDEKLLMLVYISWEESQTYARANNLSLKPNELILYVFKADLK